MNKFVVDLGHIQLAGLHTFTSGGPHSFASCKTSPPSRNSAEIDTVVALHGWLDNANSFLPLQPFLGQYLPPTHWCALDFAGHGLSGHRAPGTWYYFLEYVADVVAFLEQEELFNVHLVGHSMGGYVAQFVAAICPERVEKLTLIEAFGLWLSTEGDVVDHLTQALQDRKRLAEKRAPIYPDIERLVKLRAEKSELSEPLARLIIERNIQHIENGVTWRIDPRVRIASAFRFTEVNATDMLKRIPCKVQLIMGTEGTEALAQAVAMWRKYVPQLQVHYLAGGHHVHMQQPEQVVELIANLR